MIRALETRFGVDLMSAPRVTTLSGRQTQIKVVDVRNIATQWGQDGPPATETVECGPIVDIVGQASPDQLNLHMSVVATVREFLGYDPKPGNTGPGPLFRQRQVVTPATIPDGQTLVLDAGAVLLEDPQKLPVFPGDVPVPGQLFQAEKKPVPKHIKRLLIFITPTLIDPAGNRIHPDQVLGIRTQENGR